MDKGSGLNVGEDNSVTKMTEEKAKLDNEVRQKNDIIAQLESQKIHSMENDLLREKDEIEKLKQENDKLKDDKSREERKNKYAEEEKKNMQQSSNQKDKELADLTAKNNQF